MCIKIVKNAQSSLRKKLRMKLPSDDGDDVAESDDQETFDQTSLTDDPGETQEEHDTPDVQQASHENALEPNNNNFFQLQTFILN